MGKVVQIWDRLTNIMTGLGTSIDQRATNFYSLVPLTAEQAEAAYRSSWLVRKIIDIPPFDMTREWRDWQADRDTIEKIEAEEKRLQIKAKCQRALILARLFGGGALILGTTDIATEQPLNVDSVKADGFKYMHVMSRWQLGEGQPRMDPADEWFGQPDFFTINTDKGQVRLHPSRVVAFVGQRPPEGGRFPRQSWFWGDPIMQAIGDAVRNADLAQSGFASLIDRAAVDVFQFKDLMSIVGTTEGEDKIRQRVDWASRSKSTHRAMLIDAEDDWKQVQVSWNGIPDVMLAFMDVVAGAADIPLTRLLGQSPRGLQSTGDGEARDYSAMVKARQSEMLAPALDQIDELLLRSALGTKPTDVYYEFGSLDDVNEKDAATIEFQIAQAVKLYSDTGIFPEAALSEIAKNRMIESGRWPGSETAFEDAEPDAGDPNEATEPGESEMPVIEKVPPAEAPLLPGTTRVKSHVRRLRVK